MALCRSSGIASKMYVMPQLGVRISWRERYKPGPWHHPSAPLKLKCNSPKSGYNKGTIRSDIRYLVVSKDVRRHRLISIDYIKICHGRGREFESRRPRHSAHSSTYACGRVFAWAQKGTNSARGVKFRAQMPYNNVTFNAGLGG
jgi:hypothetical protein